MVQTTTRVRKSVVYGLVPIVVGVVLVFITAIFYLGNKTEDTRSEFFVPGTEDSTAVFGEEAFPEVSTQDGGYCQAQVFVPSDGDRVEAAVTQQSGPVTCGVEISANTEAGWGVREVDENQTYESFSTLYEAAVRLCGFHDGGVSDNSCTILLISP